MKPGLYSTLFKKERIPFIYCTSQKEAVKILKKILQKYPAGTLIGLDTETAPKEEYLKYPQAGLSPHLNRIRLLQIYTGSAVCLFDFFSIKDKSIFKEFFETYNFVAHNAIFDLKQLYMLGFKNINIDCTMLMFINLVHARFPTDEGLRMGLAPVMEGFFGIKVSKANQAHNWECPVLTYEQLEYAALDAIYVYNLYNHIRPSLVTLKLMKYYTLCKDLQHVVAEIELAGIRLNRKKHIKHVDMWREELFDAKKNLVKLTGLTKITNHTVSAYLVEHLSKDYLDIWPKTETGQLKSDAQTLADFEHLDIVAPFLKFKKLSKMTTSFGMGLLSFINPETGRIHPSYRICGARTGRWSCSRPNCQQIPRDPLIRKSFVPSKDNVYVSCDYSMIELRVIAELGNDKQMLKAFRDSKDLHDITASAVSHVPVDKVTKEQRQVAKCCNYGFVFGLGYQGLIAQAKKNFGIDMDMEEAKTIKDSFGDMYSGVTAWQAAQVNYASSYKSVRTPYGKIRKLDPTNCYGAAMNTPVQGGAAECIFMSLLQLVKNRGDVPFKIVSCVHDEIMLECPKKYAKKAAEILENSMISGFKTIFPSGVTTGLVDAKIGKSWHEVH